jgi:predicted methyltransferase
LPASVDAAVTALNFHDVYNASGRQKTIAFAESIFALLRPGGVLGVIDHEGSADQDNSALHRMQSRQAFATLEAAGFEISGTSEMLRNSKDGLHQKAFASDVRGKTSRFIIRAVKPTN